MAKKYYDAEGNEVKKKGGCLKKTLIGLGIFFLIGAIGSMFGSDEDISSETKQDETEQVEKTENKEPKEQEKEEPKEQEKEETEEKESVPQEYKNALRKAESYAKNMYMSKQGVYDQLVSEYGEGFPPEAAQYAVDNLEVDYKANALEKAKSYYEDMAMSKDHVYEQLVSEYGEQFTPEEAQYAVDNLE